MSNKLEFTVILTEETEKCWLCNFFNEKASFGPVLEKAFDAKLIDNPDRSQFQFETTPENKDKLVYAFKKSLINYFDISKRTGEYFSFEQEDMEKLVAEVKKLKRIPQLD